jgi:hypothetical protein
MRILYLAAVAVIAAACTGSSAGAQTISAGTYNITGEVVAAASSGGANCSASGDTVQGFAYYPAAQNNGKNFSIALNPHGPHAVALTFPPLIDLSIGQQWTDMVGYVLPPSTEGAKGPFALTLKQAAEKSFVIRLATTLNGPNAGTCQVTYHLSFKKGIPALF